MTAAVVLNVEIGELIVSAERNVLDRLSVGAVQGQNPTIVSLRGIGRFVQRDARGVFGVGPRRVDAARLLYLGQNV